MAVLKAWAANSKLKTRSKLQAMSPLLIESAIIYEGLVIVVEWKGKVNFLDKGCFLEKKIVNIITENNFVCMAVKPNNIWYIIKVTNR